MILITILFIWELINLLYFKPFAIAQLMIDMRPSPL